MSVMVNNLPYAPGTVLQDDILPYFGTNVNPAGKEKASDSLESDAA
jgi:hypothetical protein